MDWCRDGVGGLVFIHRPRLSIEGQYCSEHGVAATLVVVGETPGVSSSFGLIHAFSVTVNCFADAWMDGARRLGTGKGVTGFWDLLPYPHGFCLVCVSDSSQIFRTGRMVIQADPSAGLVFLLMATVFSTMTCSLISNSSNLYFLLITFLMLSSFPLSPFPIVFLSGSFFPKSPARSTGPLLQSLST